MDRVGKDKIKLLDMLRYLSFETTCIEENIPMYVCDVCQVNLSVAYNLKLMCQKNNIYVRRYIFYLKQFTHPTSFAKVTQVATSVINKEILPETTNKTSDDIIKIELDLTNISDAGITTTPRQNEPESLPAEVSNKPQPIVEQQCETSNTSILSERPEFNNAKSGLLKLKNSLQICSIQSKTIVSDISYNKVGLNNKTLPISQQIRCANKVAQMSPRTGILSNRLEFNVYKNLNTQSLINCQSVTNIKTDLNNKLTSNVQSTTSINSKATFELKSTDNFTSSTNQNRTSLKRKSEEKLIKMHKSKKSNCTNIQKQFQFDDFDIFSNVKLKKRKIATVKSPRINMKSGKKVQKMAYNIRKDRKAIQRMNSCKVVLHRVKIITPASIQCKTNMEEIASEMTDTDLTTHHNGINMIDNNACNGNIKIKEEMNEELENTYQNCTALQNKTTDSGATQEPSSNVTDFENIKQEICDIEDTPMATDEDKSESMDISFKIEIVDDNSTNTVKIETITDGLNTSTSSENITSSVFSFSNAEFLTNRDTSVNLTNGTTTSTIQEYCQATVGSTNVTMSADKVVELVSNFNTSYDDSTDSDELVIDEDAMSNDERDKITSPISVLKGAPSKVLSPRNVGKNVCKKFLNFTMKESVERDEKETFLKMYDSDSDSEQTIADEALSEQTIAVKDLPEQTKAVKADSEQITAVKDLSEQTIAVTALSEQTIAVKTISELEKELSTVQLPNYKFPVNKRLLNFTSKDQPFDSSAPTSNQLHHEQETFALKLPKLNDKHATCKTTVGSPTSVEKPDITVTERKVGRPATETSVDGTEKPARNFKLTPLQFLMQEMYEESEINDNNTVTETLTGAENTSNLPTVGSTEIYEDTTSVQSESSSNSDDSKQYNCLECNRSFATTFKMKQHKLSHINFYHCPICEENFAMKGKFKAHMIIHKEHKFKCFICDKMAPTKDALDQHYRAEHKSIRNCRHCKVIFDSRSAHTEHKKTHQEKRTCPFCNEQFSLYTFKDHTRSHEISKCLLCEKHYDIKQISTHNCRKSWEKTFKCTKCDMTFYFQSSLDKHMRVHNEMRCFICDATFYKQRDIVEHMSKHYGPQGYQCPTCDYCSFSEDDIKLHVANDYDCKIALQTMKI